MALDFPNSPTLGQLFNSGSLTWRWDGTKWVAASTLTGLYFPNKLINPFMEIDQANEGVARTSNGYVVDGWAINYTGGTCTLQRSTDAPQGYPNSVLFTMTAGATVGSSNYVTLTCQLEGDDIADTNFGLASAQTISLAIWAKASIAGTYCGSIRNSAFNRSYPFNLVIAAANTWQLFSLSIPGDVTGTWVRSGNAVGMQVVITPASGSGAQGTANTWQTGGVIATPAISNSFMTTTNATFQLGPCGLWVAPVPQPLLRTNIRDELDRCQRYYEKSYDFGTAIGAATTNGISTIAVSALGAAGFVGTNAYYKQTKRALPTLTLYSPTTGAAGKVRDFSNNVDLTPGGQGTGQSALLWSCSPTGTNNNVGTHWTADARL